MHFTASIYYFPVALLFGAMLVVAVAQFLKIRQLKKEALFAELINSASVGGYYTWQKNGDIEKFSPTLISMFRLSAGSYNFAAIGEIFGDLEDELLTKVTDLKNGKSESFHFTGKVLLQDFEKEFQCIGCAIINESDYIVTGIVIWFFDVSPYTQQINNLSLQTTQLNRELKEYASIFNTLPMPIWKRNHDYKIRFCNFVYSKFVDGEGDNTNGSEIPELDQSLHSLSVLARDNGRALRMKKHLVVQGERRFFSITEMAIKNSDEVLGFAYDITDQDEIEKELARHISAHADLLESSSSAMAVYGPDTKLRFYNNAFVNLWGLRVKWLDTNPTYGEILEVLREKRKLPEQAVCLQYL